MEKQARFWANVDIGSEDECWPWLGRKDQAGYGLWGHLRSAHVYVWLYGRGPLVYGLEIDHTCNRRDCCNPAHYELVTHAENCARAAARRTHCPNGHPRGGENAGPGKNPCRTCNREAQARWRQAHPEEHRLAQRRKYQRTKLRRATTGNGHS
jgi:hypothetical protein